MPFGLKANMFSAQSLRSPRLCVPIITLLLGECDDDRDWRRDAPGLKHAEPQRPQSSAEDLSADQELFLAPAADGEAHG